MGLREFYFGMEDKYYAFMDWLEEKGVKVYEYFVNPIENNHYPSFPFFVLIALLLLAGIALGAMALLAPQAQFTSLKVKVSGGGELLDGVPVQLSIEGQEPMTATTTNGIASFEKVPLNKKFTLSVKNQAGFADVEKPVILLQPQGAPVQVALTPSAGAEGPTQFLKVYVEEEGTNYPLSGAMLSFTHPETGEEISLSTDSVGMASVSYVKNDSEFQFYATSGDYDADRKICKATSASCTITLKRSTPSDNPGQPGATEPKGSVTVRVSFEGKEACGSKGDSCPGAVVWLYNSADGGKIDSKRTDDQGAAFFDKVVVQGTEVYVSVKPDDSSAYENYVGDGEIKQVSEDTEFYVPVSRVVQPSSGATAAPRVISLKVVDEADNAVKDAQVRFFLFSKPSFPMPEELSTEANGSVSYTIASGIQVYATVYADGFLPYTSSALKAGDSKTFKLVTAIPGNNGGANIEVTDFDGTVGSSATVSLWDANGFSLGIPPATTGEDGLTSFSGLPLNKDIKAVAVKEVRRGESDSFQARLGEEEANVPITLQPTKGKLSVSVKNVDTNAAIAGAVVSWYVEDKSQGTCKVPANADSCVLDVPAATEIYFKATASGYRDFVSEKLSVKTGQLVKREVKLVSAASTKLVITDFNLYRYDGQKVVKTAPLDRGAYYTLQFSASFPSADKDVLFLRVGDAASASEDMASVVEIKQPSVGDVSFGSTFSESDCASNAAGGESSETKWVEYTIPKTVAGKPTGISPTLALTVFVKQTADKSKKLRLYYRIHAVKTDAFYRVPEDSVLLDKEKTAEKDSCQAETLTEEYTISDGGTRCNENACITTLFTVPGSNTNVSDGLSIPLDAKFNLRAEVRAFNELESPFLKISGQRPVKLFEPFPTGSTPSSTYFIPSESGSSSSSALTTPGNAPTMYSITVPLQFDAFHRALPLVTDQTPDGLNLQAILTSQRSEFAFMVGDANGDVYNDRKSNRYVRVTGTGVMTVKLVSGATGTQETGGSASASPSPAPSETVPAIEANKDSDLVVNVSTSSGEPVPDARVYLVEVDDGSKNSPFDNFPDGPVSVLGGENGQGENGIYKLEKVHPVSIGRFDVVAERNGFADSKLKMAATASTPLEYNPSDSPVGLTCDKLDFTVKNTITAKMTVKASAVDTPCVKITGAGVSSGHSGDESMPTYTFELKGGEEKALKLQPLRDTAGAGGTCQLAFSAKAGSIMLSQADIKDFSVECEKMRCSSQNCKYCTPDECVQDVLQPYCTLSGQTCQQIGGGPGPTGAGAVKLIPPTPANGQNLAEGTASFPVKAQLINLVGAQSCVVKVSYAPAAESGYGQEYPQNYNSNPYTGRATSSEDTPSSSSADSAAGGETDVPGTLSQDSCDASVDSSSPGKYTFHVEVTAVEQAALPSPSPVYATGEPAATETPTPTATASVVPEGPTKTYSSETRTVTVPFECYPPQFNFLDILANRLGRMNALQMQTPYSNAVTALSAPVKVVFPGGVSGGGSVTKTINPLVPMQAMAFSVSNMLGGMGIPVEVRKQGGGNCYVIQEVGHRSGFGQFLGGMSDYLPTMGNLMNNEFRTYVVMFKATPDCLKYSFEGGTAQAALTEAAAQGVTITVGSPASPGNTYSVSFKVDVDNSVGGKYAFIAMPTGGTVKTRGTKGSSFEEPAYFVNNINAPSQTITLNGPLASPVTLAPRSKSKSKLVLKETGPIKLTVGTGSGFVTSASMQFTDAPKGLDAYDIVGSIGSEGTIPCTGADYCTDDQVKEAVAAVKADLESLYTQMASQVDTLNMDNPLKGTPKMMDQALRDAWPDYMNQLNDYERCKQMNKDPMQATRDQCNQNGQAPYYGGGYPYGSSYGGYGGYYPYGGGYGGGSGYPYGNTYGTGITGAVAASSSASQPQSSSGRTNSQTFGDQYGQGWGSVGCNPSVLNAYPGQPYPQAAFNPYMSGLQYGSSDYSQREPIIKDFAPEVSIPFKVAGAGGGIKLYTFKVNAAAFASLQGGGTSSGELVDVIGGYGYGYYGPVTATTNAIASGSSTPSTTTSSSSVSSFPYRKLDSGSKTYKLVGWDSQYFPPTPVSTSSSSSSTKTTGGTSGGTGSQSSQPSQTGQQPSGQQPQGGTQQQASPSPSTQQGTGTSSTGGTSGTGGSTAAAQAKITGVEVDEAKLTVSVTYYISQKADTLRFTIDDPLGTTLYSNWVCTNGVLTGTYVTSNAQGGSCANELIAGTHTATWIYGRPASKPSSPSTVAGDVQLKVKMYAKPGFDEAGAYYYIHTANPFDNVFIPA